jgi:hypothetical protein
MHGVVRWLAVSAVVATAACTRSPVDPPDDLARAGRAAVATSWGTYVVETRTSTAPIVVGAPFSLEVRVAPPPVADGDATVAVDAGMPAHGHGMNLVPRVRRVDEGTFAVDGMLLHMPGAWELYVDVTSAGETERATFAFDVEG